MPHTLPGRIRRRWKKTIYPSLSFPPTTWYRTAETINSKFTILVIDNVVVSLNQVVVILFLAKEACIQHFDIVGNRSRLSLIRDRVRCLVTMGSIHKVPENESTCVTCHAGLSNTPLKTNYPGAFLKAEGMNQLRIHWWCRHCLRRTKSHIGNNNSNSAATQLHPPPSGAGNSNSKSNRVAFTSYKFVAGTGNLIDDDVVPLE